VRPQKKDDSKIKALSIRDKLSKKDKYRFKNTAFIWLDNKITA